MGIKWLKMQMMLQLIGNPVSCVYIRRERERAAAAGESIIKLIKWDGEVKMYKDRIKVSDVLMEYPKHLVCCSDSFYIGHKIPPLSLNHQLQPGHNYFLLPHHCFQIVLSFVTIASFVTTTPRKHSADDSLQPLLKKAATCKAFDIQKSPSGGLRIRVSDEFVSRLMEDNNQQQQQQQGLCTTPQLHKDYRLLVGSRHYWKPKLEPIREKKEMRKLSSFGLKNNNNISHPKKSHNKTILHVHLQPPSRSKPSISKAKAKLKIKSRK